MVLMRRHNPPQAEKVEQQLCLVSITPPGCSARQSKDTGYAQYDVTGNPWRSGLRSASATVYCRNHPGKIGCQSGKTCNDKLGNDHREDDVTDRKQVSFPPTGKESYRCTDQDCQHRSNHKYNECMKGCIP